MSESVKGMVKEKVAGVPNLRTSGENFILACSGCQEPIIVRLILEALEELKIDDMAIGIYGIGCTTGFMMGVTNLDCVVNPHGRGPDVATGVKRSSPENIVFTVQGDGDLLGIGAGALVGALTRSEKITIFLSNNTNYGTTGGQMAPTTLVGQVTTTCTEGRDPRLAGYPTHAAELVAGFKGAAYSARGALISPAHFSQAKKYVKTALQKQIDNVGLSLVEILTACPTNWHMSPLDSLKWIEEKMIKEFPLGEFKNVDKIE